MRICNFMLISATCLRLLMLQPRSFSRQGRSYINAVDFLEEGIHLDNVCGSSAERAVDETMVRATVRAMVLAVLRIMGFFLVNPIDQADLGHWRRVYPIIPEVTF